jgi:hypothetical protein
MIYDVVYDIVYDIVGASGTNSPKTYDIVGKNLRYRRFLGYRIRYRRLDVYDIVGCTLASPRLE